MKKPVFIVAGDGSKLDTEADLFARLDRDEAFLLNQHPLIDDDLWRSMVNFTPNHDQDQLAVITIDRLRELRGELQNRETPPWRVAAMAISYQDMVMIYRQPGTQTAVGRVNAYRKKARKPKDELAMRVMRHLRGKGKTWKKTLRALGFAASNESKIADVEIEQVDNKFIFTLGDDDNRAQVESFTASTLQYKKFKKAR